MEIDYINISLLKENDKTLLKVVLNSLYLVIGLIAIICILNIINIIDSNMEKRKMDFAILRSLGLSQKGLKKLIMYESIFLIVGILILGIPLSVLVVLRLMKISRITSNKNAVVMPFPTNYFIIAFILVTILILIIMYYNFYKMKKQNLIETIRNEMI